MLARRMIYFMCFDSQLVMIDTGNYIGNAGVKPLSSFNSGGGAPCSTKEINYFNSHI